jgi:hypothetical protein
MREPHTSFLKLLTHNLDIRLNVAVIYVDGAGKSVARRTVLNAVFCRWRHELPFLRLARRAHVAQSFASVPVSEGIPGTGSSRMRV